MPDAPPVPLTAIQIEAALLRLPGWKHVDDALVRRYRCLSFPDALAFMQECAEAIERIAHHPEWTNVYDRVDVRLSTHDAGNRITAKDVELAKILDWTHGLVQRPAAE